MCKSLFKSLVDANANENAPRARGNKAEKDLNEKLQIIIDSIEYFNRTKITRDHFECIKGNDELYYDGNQIPRWIFPVERKPR